MRPSRHEWAMSLVAETAKRSTCCRRQVGCVLLNARGHVISTGYNGVAAGMAHCNEKVESANGGNYPNACSGAFSPSGTNLEGCEAIHAEANALLQCRDVYDVDACYVSASPCIHCVKLLLNTGCKKIFYAEEYPHSSAAEIWLRSGGEWRHFVKDTDQGEL